MATKAAPDNDLVVVDVRKTSKKAPAPGVNPAPVGNAVEQLPSPISPLERLKAATVEDDYERYLLSSTITLGILKKLKPSLVAAKPAVNVPGYGRGFMWNAGSFGQNTNLDRVLPEHKALLEHKALELHQLALIVKTDAVLLVIPPAKKETSSPSSHCSDSATTVPSSADNVADSDIVGQLSKSCDSAADTSADSVAADASGVTAESSTPKIAMSVTFNS